MKSKRSPKGESSPEFTNKQRITIVLFCIDISCALAVVVGGLIIEITERIEYPHYWLQNIAAFCRDSMPVLSIVGFLLLGSILALMRLGILDDAFLK